MSFRLGQTYYGCSSEDGPCSDEQRFVVGNEGGLVQYQTPHGLGEVFTATEAEFETWRSRSERRTYVGADGVRKTRLTAPVLVEAEPTVEVIEVGSVEVQTMPLAEWLEWRDTAQ